MGARITYRFINGKPKTGHEFRYSLAMRHRNKIAKMSNDCKWWQVRRKERLHQMWLGAMFRFGLHAEDYVYEP